MAATPTQKLLRVVQGFRYAPVSTIIGLGGRTAPGVGTPGRTHGALGQRGGKMDLGLGQFGSQLQVGTAPRTR